MLWEHDYEGAKRAFQRGLELNPQHTQGRTWYGLFVLQWVGGQLQEGVAELRRAYDDDPLSAYAATMLGFGLATAGETEEGLRFARLATERDPEALVGHWTHGLVAQWHGASDESLAAFARACEVSSRAEYPLVQMAVAYADVRQARGGPRPARRAAVEKGQGLRHVPRAGPGLRGRGRHGCRHGIRAAVVRRARAGRW